MLIYFDIKNTLKNNNQHKKKCLHKFNDMPCFPLFYT
jgi:hypothetical protein